MQVETYIGYVRVSTEIQLCSLEMQEQKIRDYCRLKGVELTELLVDDNISGKIPLFDRPEGKKIKELKPDNIIAFKLDRLFRSTTDVLNMIDVWNKQGTGVHILDMGGTIVDTKSATGRMFITLITAFSEFERYRIGERTADSLQYKKAQGQVYSCPVFGFDQEDGKLIKNPKEQEWINIIFAMRKENKSLQYIADYLNEVEVKPKGNGKIFYGSTIRYILENTIHEQHPENSNRD